MASMPKPKRTPAAQPATMPSTAGDVLLASLKRHGVEHLFVNPGTDFPPIVEGLARARESGAGVPRAVLAPHENLAVAMAHGAYLMTGAPQAIMVHVNVGTANTVNMLADASRDRIPLLLMAGRSPILEEGAFGARNRSIHWAQEMFDQAGMVREFVKWDYELRNPEQAHLVVPRALEAALASPSGPVYLTLPREPLSAPVAAEAYIPPRMPPAPAHPDPAAIDRLAGWIAEARRPLIIASNVGRLPGETTALARLAERLHLPVVAQTPRFLCLPTDHPMHAGFDSAPFLAEADLILVVESDVPWMPGVKAPNPEARIVHIGEDPAFLRYPMRSFRSDLSIAAGARPVLEALEAARGGREADSNWGKRPPRPADADAPHITPEYLSRCIGDMAGPDGIIVNEYQLRPDHCARTRPGTYFALSPAGGLGWSVGAALGAKLAAPDRFVVATIGDGGFVFANPTACHWAAEAHGLPIVMVIFNNSRYAAVRNATLSMFAAGWRVAELDAQLIAAGAALRAGDLDMARELLEVAGRARGSGPLEMRVRGWHARAMLRAAEGDRRGALAALRAGLALVEQHQAVLGATELRVHVSAFGAELAALGLDLAVAGDDPRGVLAWAERWRARASRLRPVRPPDDPVLADALVELRQLTAESTKARLAGAVGPDGTRRRAAEERVIRASRLARSQLHRPAGPPPTTAELLAALGDAALVEYIQRNGELYAVTLRRGRCRFQHVAARTAVSALLDGANAALRTLALAFGTSRGRTVIRQALAENARRLDTVLFGQLRAEIGDRRLVIVPTGSLHAAPWGLLPSLADRPVTIAPSAATWLRAAGGSADPGTGDVFAAGPGLPAARTEVAAIAGHDPAATTLLGEHATVPAVLAALDGADLAHIAAHGVLRTDNPLLSALELADGPLTVYDLERISRAPRTVVLPACQSGVNAVRAGDELLGLVSALLALGTQTVVAATVPVSDALTEPLMVSLHDQLRRGAPMAEALPAARAAADQKDDGAVAVAASFVCFGA